MIRILDRNVRRASARAGTAVALALLSGSLITAEAQEADPVDVESIDAIITAVYDVISGNAGETRD